MNKRTLVRVMVYALICAGCIEVTNAVGDFLNENAARDYAIQEAADIYFRSTGKQADYTNLVQSLGQTNAYGKHASEVVVALELIYLSGRPDEALAEKVSACYQNNPYWLIRLKCVEVMGVIDDAAADKYACEMLNDSDAGLESKILVARELLKRGRLFGYPVLLDGLTSSNKYERRIAEELKVKFENYDGQIYDNKSKKKIEIKELMEKVKEVNEAQEKEKKGVEKAAPSEWK